MHVAKDDVVRWTNNGSTAHHVVADDGSFESDDLSPGDNYANVFQTLGTFAYHCSIHPNMKGTVEVVETISSASAPPSTSSSSPSAGGSSNGWLFVVAGAAFVAAVIAGFVAVRRRG